MGLILLMQILLALIVLSLAIKVVRENSRLAVFRLGHFFGIRGPGVVLIIPFVDKVELIDLNKSVPEWRSLPKSELEDRVRLVALSRS